MAQRKRTPPKTPAPSSPPLLEWATAGLGLAVVLAVLGLVGWQAVSGRAGPPDIRLEPGEISRAHDGWTVEVRARNEGDQTAAQVRIEGRLGEETSGAEFDYLPAHGRSTATLRFDEDPRRGLELSVQGWREP